MTQINARSKSDEAYQRLRSLIENGHFKPGQRLTEANAASILEMGRSPVRESLLRLEADGLLKHQGKRRSRVIVFSEDEDPAQLLARYELREQVEAGAARLAAKNMTGRQIEQLRHLAERTQQYLSAGHREARYETNKAFHHYLVHNCGNPLVAQAWEGCRLMPSQPRTAEYEEQIMARIPPEERNGPSLIDVVSAIASHDQEGAERLMRRLIRTVTTALEKTIWSDRDPERI
jgi:DNA-binding GntR family transcriptional regulator